jgi:cobalt-zinc-cadmium efflux system membrane fusion protein
MKPISSILAVGVGALLAACGGGDESPRDAASGAATHRAVTPVAAGASDSDEHGHAEAEAGHADGEEGHGDEAVLELTAAEAEAAGIRVEAVAETTLADRISVAASVHANQRRLAHVAPRVAGRIARVNVSQGERVGAGQTLALIDSIEVGEAQAVYLEASSQLSLAQAEHERAEQLFAEQIIAAKERLRARAEFEKAKAAVRAAGDRLRLLGVRVPDDSSVSSVYALVAPFAGTVIEVREAVVGEPARPDESLFTIADLSTVWVEASLAEKDLARVRTGARAVVDVAAYPGERFPGRVTYVSNVLDKETHTVQARIEVPNPDTRLKVEMFATAHIELDGERSQAVVLPAEAIVLMAGKPVAFVEDGGAFEPREIELGATLASGTVVRSGIAPGERVAVAGAYSLKARALKSQMGEGHAH